MTFLLVVSGCGGSSDTTTVAPETPSTPSPTAEPAASSETASSELDQAFVLAVKDFIATEWVGWPNGVILGECLATNASAIGDPAKQGVIDYGLEKVYDNISQFDSNSLSVIWNGCETVDTSSKAEVAAEAVENRPDAPTFVPSTSSSPFSDGVETAFKAAVDAEFLAAAEKAGISVAVFSNGSLWTYASGIASSIAEMTPNTPMLIRSTSKTFLSALILNQAEQGLFELGNSLQSVLSDHPDYPSLDTVIFNPAVSINEMLSMRSGLAPRDPLAAGESDVFSNIEWRPVDILKLSKAPWVEPGNFEYSDTNSVLLGLVAEHHVGNSLNVLYQDAFFNSLGITAGLGPQDGFPLNTARPYGDLTLLAEQRNLDISGFGDEIEASDYLADPRDWYAGSTRLGWASAGMFTTAENVARWAYELYSPDGRAISPSNRTRLLNSVNAELVNFENRMQRYGYYITESEVVLGDQKVVTVYGHPGGGTNFISKLAYSPELDLAVSILTNSPMRYAGSCPDHSADKSQQLTPQLCIVQEIFAAYAGTTATSAFDPPTTTAEPTTTATPTTTVAPTTTASNGLVANCTLDTEKLRISCKASGYEDGSRLTWTSTASWANSQGSQWDFKIDQLIGTGTKVFLEECQGSNCQIVETSIDTSILLGDDSTTTADLVEDSVVQCDERVLFQHPPVDLTAIEYIIPMGNMAGDMGHVTPTDHSYFDQRLELEKQIDVFSPAEGIVISIQRMALSVMEGGGEAIDDHRIVIEHPCSVSSHFIHIEDFAPRLQSWQPPPGGYASVQIPVEAGELLGTFAANLDYNIVDLNFTLDGFLVPSSYMAEPWKIHTPDWFGYYTPEIQEQLVALSPRTIEPFAGQIAYDVDGRLVGTWFQQGTNGYGGADQQRYWAGHLTFAYDNFDPRAIVVSVGTFDERATTGAVTGNRPDPVDVTIESGLILYELRPWDYYVDGTYWNQWNLLKGPTLVPRTESYGVIAVELVGDRELRVEMFPGLVPADIEGFSTAALTYVR